MRCEGVRLGDVGVVFLLRDATEGHDFRLGPCLEISRGGPGDGADPSVAFAGPYAKVEHIAVFGGGPEGDILGIEDTFGEDGFILKLAPMDAIGGGEGEETMLVVSGDGLEFFAGVGVGVGVEKGGEVVGDLHFGIIFDQNNIRIGVILEGEEAQIGFYPSLPVTTFGVAGKGSGSDGTMATIVDSKEVTIADEDDVEAVGTFPGLVEGDCDCRRGGIDEFVGDPG